MKLHRRQIMQAGLGAAAAATLSGTAARAQDDRVFTLSYQGSHPPNQAYTTVTGLGFRTMVEARSNGRIRFQYYDAGGLTGVGGMLEAADTGILDVSQSWGGFFNGDIPEADVECGLPGAWSDPWEAYDAYYNRGMLELISGIYESRFNVKYFPAIISLRYGIASRTEVNSLADLNGKRIRAIGVFGDFVSQLGAAPAAIPAQELYTAMQLGTVDGVVYGAEAIAAAGLQDFVNTMIVSPNLNTGVGHWLINRDKWEALPEDLQKVIEDAVHYGNLAQVMNYSAEEARFIARLKEAGVKYLDLADEDLARYRGAMDVIWSQIAAKTPQAAEAVEILRQQQRDYGRA